MLSDNREIPPWIDEVLKQGCAPDPYRRHEALSEYVTTCGIPTRTISHGPTPLIERNPVLFWKALSFILTLVIVLLLFSKYGSSRRNRT